MEPDDTDQLRDPLLQLEEPRSNELQRRRNTTTPSDRDVEALEVQAADAAVDQSDDWHMTIGPKELRFLWIFFQCLWSALVLVVFGSDAVYYVSAYVCYIALVLVPSAIIFCLLACSRRNQNERFRFHYKDGIPTVVWILLPLVDSFDHGIDIFLTVVFFVAMITILVTCVWAVTFEPSPLLPFINVNCYKKLEDDFFEQEQQREDAAEEKLASQKAKLSHLEQLSETKKPSAWMIVALAIIGMWMLWFVFFVSAPMLKESPDSHTQK